MQNLDSHTGLPPEQIETRAAWEMRQHDLSRLSDEALVTLRATYAHLADCLRKGITIIHLPKPQSVELWDRCAQIVHEEIERPAGSTVVRHSGRHRCGTGRAGDEPVEAVVTGPTKGLLSLLDEAIQDAD